jgi:hypothetical protein
VASGVERARRPWREPAPARAASPAGGGGAGRGRPGRGRRGARGAGPGPRSPAGRARRGSQGGPARPGARLPRRQRPGAGDCEAERLEGAGRRRREANGGCEPRAPRPGPARPGPPRAPPLPPSLASPPRVASCRLLASPLRSSAGRRSHPRPGRRTQPGRAPPSLARSLPRRKTGSPRPTPPLPRARRAPDLCDRRLSGGEVSPWADCGTGLSGSSRRLRTPRVPERGHSRSRLRAPGAPGGASSLRVGPTPAEPGPPQIWTGQSEF